MNIKARAKDVVKYEAFGDAGGVIEELVYQLEKVEAERDAALTRIAELEVERDRALEGVADQRRGIARRMEDIAALEVENLDLEVRITEAEAERDAALAAIERVKAVALPATLGNYDPHNDWNVGRDNLAKNVLAALDGAPEPEWEVQYGRRNRETGALHWLTGDSRDDWWHENQDRYEHVKRYTSPPLPVEGGKR